MKTSGALPYFRWYPADAELDEIYLSMNDQELGFYHRCLNRSWRNDGIPSDLDELSRLLNRNRSYVDRLWLRVGRAFVPSQDHEDRLVNPRQEVERQWALTKSEKATDAVRVRYGRSKTVTPRVRARAESDSLFTNSNTETNIAMRKNNQGDLVEVWTDDRCEEFLGCLGVKKGCFTQVHSDRILEIDPFSLFACDQSDGKLQNIHRRLDSFENHFWKNYWKKVSKDQARKAWMDVTNGDVDQDLEAVILRGFANQRKGMMEKEEKFRPHAATWLNARRWEDEVTEVPE